VSTPQPPGVPDQPSAPTAARAPKQKPPRQPSAWQPILYLRIGLLLFALGYAIAFVVENSKQINIHFVFATAKVRLIWEILLLLAIGVVGGVLLSQLYHHRRRTQLAKKAGEEHHARPDVAGRDEAVGKSR
jgi:uncharacterized integral membrane protein